MVSTPAATRPPQTLRNYLNAVEPGHKGPVPGAAQAFILARGRFSAVYPLHLSDVSLPSSPPSPFASQPGLAPFLPSFLQAPLLLHVFPDLGGQRDGGQGVALVRPGGAPAALDRGSGSQQLQQVSLDFFFPRRESGTLAPSAFLSWVRFRRPACAHLAY